MEGTPAQIFIRNAQGQVWGPLSLASIELLLENGVVQGRVQLSEDGVNFAQPGRFPKYRRIFPREAWGDVVVPGDDALPPPPPVPQAPKAGPGTVPMAGPGAVASSQRRPQGRRYTAEPPVVSPAAPAQPAAAAQMPAPAGDGPPPNGTLTDVSFARLYYLAAAGNHTGLLTLTLADRLLEVHFRKGSPDYVGTNRPEDSLGGYALKTGLATSEQIVQAEAEKERFGGDLLSALLGLGFLNPGTAFAQLAQRASSLLFQALAAQEGTFRYEVKELPAHRVLPLGNRWSVLLEQVRKLPPLEVRRRLEPMLELEVMKSGGRVALSELRLSPQETRLLGRIDGVRSLVQLIAETPQEADPLLRLAYFLREMEAISFSENRAKPTGPAQAARPAPQAPPPTVAPASPPPAAAPVASRPAVAPTPAAKPAPPPAAAPPPVIKPSAAPASRPTPPPAAPQATQAAKPSPAPASATPAPGGSGLAELQLQVDTLKKQNHFEALGLQTSADAAAVKIAYFKLAKIYHPDTVAPGSPPEVAALKAEAFARIGDAYRILSDDHGRADYVENLKAGGKGDGIDVAQILAAEDAFQKGMILVKARRFADALKVLNDAIQMNPEEGEFYAWRGYARFFTVEDKKAAHAEAMKDINVCLKKNARCAPAHYFQGHLAKLLGDQKAALKHFQRCVELQPDHIDAQRELRLIKK